MARDYKNFRANNYYHVYNRGNNKEPIFFDDQDYQNFLKRLVILLDLKESTLRISPLPRNSYTILAYCLMQNHFHFLIRQNSEIPIDRLIGKLCMSYVKYFNKKYKRVGHLFQDTFKAKLVNKEKYLTYLSAYIHNNPPNPLLYRFSSLSEYLQTDFLPIYRFCNTTIIMSYFDSNPQHYLKFLNETNKGNLRTKTPFVTL